MKLEPIELFDLVRSIIYTWIIYEAIFLTFLYKMAWNTMKKTPIILALHNIFLFITFFYTLGAVSALSRIIDINIASPILYFMTIPALGLAVSLRNFRLRSLEDKLKEKKNV